MKKHIKWLAVLTLTAVFVTFLTGCRPYIENDDNPNDYIVMSKDEESLVYQTRTYYKIPQDAELFCTQKTNNLTNKYINVYKDGTPKAISNIFNATAYYNVGQDAFKVEFWSAGKLIFDSQTYKPPTEYYCCEGAYMSYMDYLENKAFLNRIGFEYVDSNSASLDYTFELGIIPEAASQEIIDYIDNPSKMTKDIYKEAKRQMSISILYAMFKCNDDGYLAKRLDGYDIYKVHSNASYLINHNTQTAARLSEETSMEINNKYLKTTLSTHDS